MDSNGRSASRVHPFLGVFDLKKPSQVNNDFYHKTVGYEFTSDGMKNQHESFMNNDFLHSDFEWSVEQETYRTYHTINLFGVKVEMS